MSEAYTYLAAYYDRMTDDVCYERRARYLSRLLALRKGKHYRLLDLACGTGTLTEIFSRLGHTLVGVDASEDMLAVAANKFTHLPWEERPLLLCGDMARLRLPFSVDAAFCSLDSLNYLLRPAQVQRTFRAVAEALRPGGRFAFDVHSESHLRSLDGELFTDETEDCLCLWRGTYRPRTHILTYDMDLFRRERDGRWQRSEETHRERAYTREELSAWLYEAGFTDVRVYGDLTGRAPRDGEERLYFTAKKKKA